MRCPYLENCPKQKWIEDVQLFKNPTRPTVRCRACGFSRGSLKDPLIKMINSPFFHIRIISTRREGFLSSFSVSKIHSRKNCMSRF